MAKKKEKKETQSTQKRLQKLQSWMSISKRFMEQEFKTNYEENWDRYENVQAGNTSRFSDLVGKDILWINQFYPNVEIMKSSIRFSNPRIFVRANKKEIDDESGQVFSAQDRASIVQDYLNWINYEINTKKTFEKVRDDAIIGNFGVCMICWNTEKGIGATPDDIYIKKDQQTLLYIDPRDFYVDPECTDPFEFTDARYVARRIVMPLEWAKAKFNAPNLQATTAAFGVNRAREELEKNGITVDIGDLERVCLNEIWEKPTPMEREQGKKGKVVVTCDGYMDDNGKGEGILDEYDWPYEMEGFPFSGIRLNDRNDSFYGVPDFQQYVDQVEEKSLIRTFQLQGAHVSSQIKTIIDGEILDPVDRQNIRESNAGLPPVLTVNPGMNKSVRDAVHTQALGSASAEFYNLDIKNEADLDNQSGITDLKRGLLGKSSSATESSIAQKNTDSRFQMRLDKFVDLYVRVQRKFVQLAKQYLDTKLTIRVVNDPTRIGAFSQPFSKQDLEGEFDIRIHVSEMSPMSAEVEAAKMLNTMQTLLQAMSNPFFVELAAKSGVTFGIDKFLLEIQRLLGFESLELIKRIDTSSPEGQQSIQSIIDSVRMAQQGGKTEEMDKPPSVGGQGMRMSPANQLGAAYRGAS